MALHAFQRRKGRVSINERHKWPRKCSYAMACKGNNEESIVSKLEFHRAFTCEQGGREISDCELRELASSAIVKVAQLSARRGAV